MKKVRFKDSTSVLEDEMIVDTMTTRTLSWKDPSAATTSVVVESSIKNGEYNLWMLVEWKSKRQSREPNKFERFEEGEEITGLRFQFLIAPDSKVVNRNFVKEDLSRSKKHGKRVLIDDGGKSRNGVREAVAVKGGIFDAKNQSAVVFQEKENPKLIETSDNSELFIVGGSSRSTKGKGIGEKSFGSLGV
ncbi:hypothetical protein J1N35_021769 [Gossypium stocksii]|uniref:Uncharacterized protein n=1 Tax=Gossypium stocksii TaxID=47602 RepID=A0A9D3VFG1_9ROSI|nr:hypothetical protein J1N35_021769 [Gossypium stocksii]